MPAWIGLAIGGVGCTIPGVMEQPDVRYTVRVAPSREQLDVAMEIRNPPRHGFVLRSYAPPGISRVTGLVATDSRNRNIAVEDVSVPDTSAESSGELPRFLVRGPVPRLIAVRYRVRVGVREGDAHHGFRGRSFGYLGPDFGLTTGRQALLLPEPAERIRTIRVRFELPDGWSAVVPWDRGAEGWDPAINGRLAAEHLAAAPIALGRFEEHQLPIGRTTFRIAMEASAARDDSGRIQPAVERLIRYVCGVFGDRLGPWYLLIGVPKTPFGDDIVAGEWGTGQAATLSPLTPARASEAAGRLIGAYVRHEPYRSRLGDPRDFWLVDALESFYGLQAAAAAGLVRPSSILPDLAKQYVQLLNKPPATRGLETIHQGLARPPALIRQVLAPTVLGFLDRQIKARSARGLEPFVAKVFRSRRAQPFWAVVGAGDSAVDGFRRRHVRDGLPLPGTERAALEPTLAAPPHRREVTESVTIVLTGKTDGYLENCGCKGSQAGGVARRANVIRELRLQDPGLLLLDAGSSFTRISGATDLDSLARMEQGLYLRAMSLMRYDGIAIGETELHLGPRYFEDHRIASGLRFLTVNIRQGRALLGRQWLRLRSRGIDVAVLGVFEPLPVASNPSFEDRTSPLRFDDPIDAIERTLRQVRPWADLVVAIGNLRPETIRELVRRCPDLDVVASIDDRSMARAEPPVDGSHGHGPSPRDTSGFLGDTYVTYERPSRYGLVELHLGIGRDGRVSQAQEKHRYLFSSVQDDPEIRKLLNRFYDRVGRTGEAQRSVRPLFDADAGRLTGEYVGAATCAPCHAGEHAQWKQTAHATAFKTLLEVHRHFQPRCIACHVVGYGTPNGYRLGGDEGLANVQCEVCHGPGGEHSRRPRAANIRRRVPESVCLECHNAEHSDRFVYAAAWPLVAHSATAVRGSTIPSLRALDPGRK